MQVPQTIEQWEKYTNDFPVIPKTDELAKLVKKYKSTSGVWGKELLDILHYYSKKPFKNTTTKTIFLSNLKKDLTLVNIDLFLEKEAERQANEYDYEEIEIRNLREYTDVIKTYFPNTLFETIACLSTYCTLSLKNLNGCPSLNLIGPPSGEKTTILSFFYSDKHSYLTDDFTPRSFVTHTLNVDKEELASIDLLPRIQNKVLLTPELAPLFESSRERLVDNFAMLTRVLDGEGLHRDTGAHGHRGYSGDYKFVWLGASTPLRASVWNVMGKIGNRLFFLNLRDKNRNHKDYLDMFQGEPYEEKVRKCRGATNSFLQNHFEKYPVRSVEWNAEDDILLLPEIIKYAKLLSKLRGTLMTWKGDDGKYEHNFPIIEEPPRAINALYNLAKGHALIHDRTFLRSEDLEIVRAVCFSSMPHDRSEFIKLLAKHEGKLTTPQIEAELKCSKDTASRTMTIFEVLGVVKIKKLHTDLTGRPLHYIEIEDEFRELLDHVNTTKNQNNPVSQGYFRAINNISHENNPKGTLYSDIKPEDFIKNNKKINGQGGVFHEINTKSHENNPVSTKNMTSEVLDES